MENKIVDMTKFGTVLERRGGQGIILVNGKEIAIEDDFVFSYDIANPSASLLDAVEKGEVKREDYLLDVRKIIFACDGSFLDALLSSIDDSCFPREDEFVIPGVLTHVLDYVREAGRVIVWSEDTQGSGDEKTICLNPYYKGKDDEYRAMKKLLLID